LRDAGTSGERCTLARALRDGAPLHQLRALAGSAITLVADAERAHATVGFVEPGRPACRRPTQDSLHDINFELVL